MSSKKKKAEGDSTIRSFIQFGGLIGTMKEILRDNDNYLVYREEVDGKKFLFIMNKRAIEKITVEKDLKEPS